LHIELAAMRAMLDEEHGSIAKKDIHDHNTYFGGRIQGHNVVIACLPAGVDGVSAAATVAKDMSRTFGQLRFGLLVGIAGGIPDLEAGIDIRLGDVVVSQPSGIYGGVVQYDKGKSKAEGEWERKGTLNAPPVVLLTALQSLQAQHELEESQMSSYLAKILERRPKMKSIGYAWPGVDKDLLYPATYNHVAAGTTCDGCEAAKALARPNRLSIDPQIHYGIIASGNQVIKDAAVRDNLRQDCGALCVEMEAAGLMNEFPCLVIRGICDYADSHKNDKWQRFAAATAAAYAKELLLYVSPDETSQEKPIQEILCT
jgi:nucleoside phosphorylase